MKVKFQTVSDDFKTNDKAQWLLTMFYGVYLKDKWSLEERFYQLKQWEAMLSNKKSYMIMALQNNRRSNNFRMPLGFVLCTPTDINEMVILEGLFVIPEYKRKGVGGSLIAELRKKVDIHVQSFSESIDFYKSQGFREISYRASDDTTEMSTASYEFEYNYDYIVPLPSKDDSAHMVYLKNLEVEGL